MSRKDVCGGAGLSVGRSSRRLVRQVTESKGGHGRPSTSTPQPKAGADRYTVLAALLGWRTVAGMGLADSLQLSRDSHCSCSAWRTENTEVL